ncbi:unnamed protein product [Adineta steineri]|uniref:NAD(P)(+)--arginine ADP-ribosyltransferase n=1 Tax=Adineta steineri TaxID=433720 RepID=A0A815R933_9BILA|nr:unnamed protein product [Adineta steineri]CAF4026588.1 unnamed protein product [Adineta steineri]
MSSSGDRFTDIELENKRLPACYGYINYKLLPLEEVMNEIQDSLEEINRFVKLAKRHCTYPNDHNLTKDESAAIYIYTMEMSDHSCLYRILNQTLRLEDRSEVRPWFGYLKLLDSAALKLPKFKGIIYRGIDKDVTMKFKKGERITWWSISSCSTSINVISKFISKSSSSTLFNIECLNGKSVSSYTCYPKEDEVILMPGTMFEVVSNPLNHKGGLNIIHLKEINDDDDDHEELSGSANPNSFRSNHSTTTTPAISWNPITKLYKMLFQSRSRIKQREIRTENNKYQQFAVTVAGGNEKGHQLNQLSDPLGISIDKDKSVYIADSDNHRIVKWELNSNTGQIIAGGNGKANQNNQLHGPTDIIFDKKSNSFIISEWENKRVIRYFIQNQTNQQILIPNITCYGLAIDKNGFLYVSDWENHEVRRWKQGDRKGELVAGGNGQGNNLNQLNKPTNIFVAKDYSLYVSDFVNCRVMKWTKNAKEGIIVAGGNGKGNSLKQLFCPYGVFVDHVSQIYVADRENHRVMRWCEGKEEGEIVVGGNGQGNQSNQLNSPAGFLFDNEENLYVVDKNNHRIQKFEKILNSRYF